MKKLNQILLSRIAFFALLLVLWPLSDFPLLADKLIVPLGKAVSLKISGVKKIMAVKEGVVEILNVSDDEVIISGIGSNPDKTQLLFWNDQGKVVYDVETYNETQVIQEKFQSLFPEPGVTLHFFPDAIYLKGIVNAPDKVKTAENILSKIVSNFPIVNLIEVKEGITLQQRIVDAIKIPTVKVTVIEPAGDPSALGIQPANALAVASATEDTRIVLEGTVKDQNEFMRMYEVVKGFVKDEKQISNLVTIRDPLQVIFQAYILQVNRNKTQELGIEWGGTDAIGGTLIPGKIRFFENTSDVYRGDTKLVGAPLDKWPNPFKFNNINRFDLVTATVNAWVSKNLAKVLSNPKLLVYANASLKKMNETGWEDEKNLGEGGHQKSTSYVKVSQRISYPGPVTTQGISSPEYIDADLTLAIRDLFINEEDNSLKFSVYAQQDEPIAKGNNLPPDIFKRSVMTTVKMKNEETIVLGGLINDARTESENRVPGLSRLPLIGKLFRRKVTAGTKNELVIVLTPKIINRDTDLTGNKKFEVVPVPRRSERLEELHRLFQDIKKSHFPGKADK